MSVPRMNKPIFSGAAMMYRDNIFKISFEKKETETNYFSDYYKLSLLEKKIEIKQK